MEDRALLAVFSVTTTTDVLDAADGLLSLREAMIAAEANGGDDTINLPAGTYSLTLDGVENSTSGLDGTINDLDLTNSNGGQVVTIAGAGAASTIIDGGNFARHFHVSQASGSIVNLVIQDVTLQNGSKVNDATDGSSATLEWNSSTIAVRQRLRISTSRPVTTL